MSDFFIPRPFGAPPPPEYAPGQRLDLAIAAAQDPAGVEMGLYASERGVPAVNFGDPMAYGEAVMRIRTSAAQAQILAQQQQAAAAYGGQIPAPAPSLIRRPAFPVAYQSPTAITPGPSWTAPTRPRTTTSAAEWDRRVRLARERFAAVTGGYTEARRPSKTSRRSKIKWVALLAVFFAVAAMVSDMAVGSRLSPAHRFRPVLAKSVDGGQYGRLQVTSVAIRGDHLLVKFTVTPPRKGKWKTVNAHSSKLFVLGSTGSVTIPAARFIPARPAHPARGGTLVFTRIVSGMYELVVWPHTKLGVLVAFYA
jgi:hypothetical protein